MLECWWLQVGSSGGSTRITSAFQEKTFCLRHQASQKSRDRYPLGSRAPTSARSLRSPMVRLSSLLGTAHHHSEALKIQRDSSLFPIQFTPKCRAGRQVTSSSFSRIAPMSIHSSAKHQHSHKPGTSQPKRHKNHPHESNQASSPWQSRR